MKVPLRSVCQDAEKAASPQIHQHTVPKIQDLNGRLDKKALCDHRQAPHRFWSFGSLTSVEQDRQG